MVRRTGHVLQQAAPQRKFPGVGIDDFSMA